MKTAERSPFEISTKRSVVVVKGNLVDMHILQQTGPIPRRVIRLYHATNDQASYLDVTTDVNIKGEIDRELLTRYTTNIQSDLEFYTDMNGFQMQRRKTRTDRPTGHNFYPATSAIFHEDEMHRFTVLTKQAMGVGSLDSGELQIVLDRTMTMDDNRGLHEGVRDNLPLQYRFALLMESRSSESHSAREYIDLSGTAQRASYALNHPLEYVFSAVGSEEWKKNMYTDYAPMSRELPEDIHIVSLRNRNKHGDLIIQVARVYDDPSFSVGRPKSVALDLFDLFENFKFSQVEEHSLSYLHFKSAINNGASVKFSARQLRAFLLVADSVSNILDSTPASKPIDLKNNSDYRVLDDSVDMIPMDNEDQRANGQLPASDRISKEKPDAPDPIFPIDENEDRNEANEPISKDKQDDRISKLIECDVDTELEQNYKLLSDDLAREEKKTKDAIEDAQRERKKMGELREELEHERKKNREISSNLEREKSSKESLQTQLESLRTQLNKFSSPTSSPYLVFMLALLIFGIIVYFGTHKKSMFPIFFAIFMVANILLPFLFLREVHN